MGRGGTGQKAFPLVSTRGAGVEQEENHARAWNYFGKMRGLLQITALPICEPVFRKPDLLYGGNFHENIMHELRSFNDPGNSTDCEGSNEGMIN